MQIHLDIHSTVPPAPSLSANCALFCLCLHAGKLEHWYSFGLKVTGPCSCVYSMVYVVMLTCFSPIHLTSGCVESMEEHRLSNELTQVAGCCIGWNCFPLGFPPLHPTLSLSVVLIAIGPGTPPSTPP